MQNSQQYLKNKLKSFISDLKNYQLKLLQKIKTNSLQTHDLIYVLIQKIQLQCCHYQDQINQMDTIKLPESRLRHKTSILIQSYEKLVKQINKLILTKDNKQKYSANETRFGNSKQKTQKSSQLVSFRKQQPKRLKEMKSFIEQLNNSWMLELLNKEKGKSKGSKKNLKSRDEVVQQNRVNDMIKSPDRRKLGINHIKKQIICLQGLLKNLQNNYNMHRHRQIENELQNLKDEQALLLKGLGQVKQGSRLLKQEYENLQKQLIQLKRTNQIINQRYFQS